ASDLPGVDRGHQLVVGGVVAGFGIDQERRGELIDQIPGNDLGRVVGRVAPVLRRVLVHVDPRRWLVGSGLGAGRGNAEAATGVEPGTGLAPLGVRRRPVPGVTGFSGSYDVNHVTVNTTMLYSHRQIWRGSRSGEGLVVQGEGPRPGRNARERIESRGAQALDCARAEAATQGIWAQAEGRRGAHWPFAAAHRLSGERAESALGRRSGDLAGPV